MDKTLHFRASTNVKHLFGRGLVTDQVAAVFELVKNSYDADAKRVDIVFDGLKTDTPTLSIMDDGTGMDLQDINEKWMVIGTDSKKGEMLSPIFNRPINGDKGIGRFSVDRLGALLDMRSQKRGSRQSYSLHFDWSDFDAEAKDIEDINIYYTEQESSSHNHGVSLVISELRDEWDEEKIRELYRNLRQLKSPFSQEDTFKIYITAEEYGYHNQEVTVEKLENISSLWVTAEILSDKTEFIKLTVNKDGIEYKIKHKNLYGLKYIKAQVFMFNQGDKIRFSNRYGIRVREYGNIRLYLDNFRIYPYGEHANDWLDLDRRQTQGLLRRIGTRDLIGFVQITKKDNTDLIPLTNRQGLVENESYKQLKQFVVDECVKTLESYYFQKIKPGKNETPQKTKRVIEGAVEGLNRVASEIKSDSPDAAKQITNYAKAIKKQQSEQEKYVRDQQEIVKVYSRIAQKETFLHKLIHQSMIDVKDANTALDNYSRNVSNSDKEKLAPIKQCINSALTILKTVRDDVVKKREKTRQNITNLIKSYISSHQTQYKEDDIDVSVNAKDTILYYADSGDIIAIVNNLISNSVKSLRLVNDRKRKIVLELYKTNRYVIIKCIDNGIGIPETERERIFDPFQSTTDGMGLGLTIIDEICKEYNGALELVESKIGAVFSAKLGV